VAQWSSSTEPWPWIELKTLAADVAGRALVRTPTPTRAASPVTAGISQPQRMEFDLLWVFYYPHKGSKRPTMTIYADSPAAAAFGEPRQPPR
jgi:hypothetical protein